MAGTLAAAEWIKFLREMLWTEGLAFSINVDSSGFYNAWIA